MIRKGEDHSFVEANIDLKDYHNYFGNNDIKIDETIIVSRDIYSNGKNMCKINR